MILKRFLVLLFLITCTFTISSCRKADGIITINYDFNGIIENYSYEIDCGQKAVKPNNINKPNYNFIAWYKDDKYKRKFNFNSRLYNDTTIYAKYELNQDKINDTLINGGLNCHVGFKILYFNRIASKYSWGSGVVLEITDYKIYILSNSHLSQPSFGFNHIDFKAYDYLGNSVDAELEFERSDYDLAIFSCSKLSGVKETIKFAEEDVYTGQDIISVGRPGGKPNRITYGEINGITKGPDLCIINAKSDVNFDVYSHSSYINLGSSGGALLNSNLELIGINYAVKQTEEGYNFIEGYSVPLFRVYEFLNYYEEFKKTNV